MAAALACTLSLTTYRAAQADETVRVRLLGFNDFHGQLGPGREVEGRPVGSAPVLAAYLRDEIARFDGPSFIVHGGDFVGGSPYASALLQDEPAIAFLNALGNEHCDSARTPHPRCNVIGTLGNHEFDEGVPELLRLLHGPTHALGPFLDDPYRGARVAYVSANVVDARDKPLLPPFVIQQAGGIRIAFIGAVLTLTAKLVLAEGLQGARFLDEAEAINAAVRQVRARGVQAIVVTIHQGAGMIPYEGPTRRDVALPPESDIAEIVSRLDGEVDVVVTGHAHQFTNAYAKTRGGEALVTQAHVAGTAYSIIDLSVDRAGGDVVEKSARIVYTFADRGPGLTPAKDVAAITARAEEKARALLARVVGVAPAPITQVPNAAGESALGNLVTDAQRSAVGAEVAFLNQGGLRGDLDAGPIRYEELLAILPFGRVIVVRPMTGAQIRRALEEQWEHEPPRILQVSGLTYKWDAALPVGKRVLAPRVGSAPLDDARSYRVAVTDYLARGDGGFTQLAQGGARAIGPRDTEALIAFIARAKGRAKARIEARIVRRD